MAVNSLQETPMGERVHIGIFGAANSGKSSLVNALSGQDIALVSSVAGTTTDPVYKPMELLPVGPVVFIDTAGFDDTGTLGNIRVNKTREVLDKIDVAVLVFSAGRSDIQEELRWMKELSARKVKTICVFNKSDLSANIPDELKALSPLPVSAVNNTGIEELKKRLIEIIGRDTELSSITGHLVNAGDSVLLVAPQDIQAPKGRLILPQVQTIRDLLDLKALVTVVTTDQMVPALSALKHPPKLIIADSQVFPFVYEHKPEQSMLTSFSVLMARYKGDIHTYLEGVKAVDRLKETDRVLILEACTHNPLDGDIGRKKIPALLRKRVGKGLQIDVISCPVLPENLSAYSLAVQCGACMFNRRYVLSRISRLVSAGVSVTNYGILLAKLSGILDKIDCGV